MPRSFQAVHFGHLHIQEENVISLLFERPENLEPVVGDIGPVTIRALQRHVGVAQDGFWGPMTTEGLQRTLNAGTF